MNKYNPKIAFANNIFTKEDLPYPYVCYPGGYGTFFGFRKDKNSNIFLCSCAKEAIENYIRLRKQYIYPSNANPTRNFILDSMDFPMELVKDIMKQQAPENLEIINYIQFQDKLCHECNKVIPTYNYCHEMYGAVFVQKYGWYINKQFYEYGIDKSNITNFNREISPMEMLEILEEYSSIVKSLYLLKENNKNKEIIELQKRKSKIYRNIYNIIQNEVRLKFNHKKIGEAWTSETILYYIIKKLYPSLNIRRHYRPAFLQYLELDIYIEELGLGIEYQGIQHFEPIKHWGGEEALKKTRERDERKRVLCKNNNINLIYYNYYEDLSVDFVGDRITKNIEKM